jgi:N-acetylmuramoyl-L-alanine amidase
MVTPALTGTGGGFFYETNFGFGMTSQDVMELQTRLKDEGFFTSTPTGYFGPLTQSAVMAYQSAHGIPATGYVGPLTRAQLNQ